MQMLFSQTISLYPALNVAVIRAAVLFQHFRAHFAAWINLPSQYRLLTLKSTQNRVKLEFGQRATVTMAIKGHLILEHMADIMQWLFHGARVCCQKYDEIACCWGAYCRVLICEKTVRPDQAVFDLS